MFPKTTEEWEEKVKNWPGREWLFCKKCGYIWEMIDPFLTSFCIKCYMRKEEQKTV